jgi:hypothetical protein
MSTRMTLGIVLILLLVSIFAGVLLGIACLILWLRIGMSTIK